MKQCSTKWLREVQLVVNSDYEVVNRKRYEKSSPQCVAEVSKSIPFVSDDPWGHLVLRCTIVISVYMVKTSYLKGAGDNQPA